MRRAFCFSRICRRYSLSFWRILPCSPGGYGRISIGHFGESHLLPLRNSLTFSRRHSLQSAPVYRAISLSSDPAPLGRTAAIVRNGGDVLDGAHLKTGRLQRPDRGLPAGARPLDEDVDLAHPVLHGAARRGLRGLLGGVRGGLARALEPDLSRRRPRDHVAHRVRDRDDGVVERGPDVSVPVSNVFPLLAAHLLGGALLAALARRHLLPDS